MWGRPLFALFLAGTVPQYSTTLANEAYPFACLSKFLETNSTNIHDVNIPLILGMNDLLNSPELRVLCNPDADFLSLRKALEILKADMQNRNAFAVSDIVLEYVNENDVFIRIFGKNLSFKNIMLVCKHHSFHPDEYSDRHIAIYFTQNSISKPCMLRVVDNRYMHSTNILFYYLNVFIEYFTPSSKTLYAIEL